MPFSLVELAFLFGTALSDLWDKGKSLTHHISRSLSALIGSFLTLLSSALVLGGGLFILTESPLTSLKSLVLLLGAELSGLYNIWSNKTHRGGTALCKCRRSLRGAVSVGSFYLERHQEPWYKRISLNYISEVVLFVPTFN
ncbi:hypothetical protein XELAEV_18036487mg [Xenopus laevis]|uniref:Uncharacterized protein n=1 Tax=Xenopus laevis TaxID=8355 RepID=A0A974CHJ7_XENLA|nr:hypothetical protein XELAEV_18036487mg [Xenopus laevis]